MNIRSVTSTHMDFIFLTFLCFTSFVGIGLEINILELQIQRFTLLVILGVILLKFVNKKHLILDIDLTTIFVYIGIFVVFLYLAIRVSSSVETEPYLQHWHVQNINSIITTTLLTLYLSTVNSKSLELFSKYSHYVISICCLIMLFNSKDIFAVSDVSRLTMEMRLGAERAGNNINYWAMAVSLYLPLLFICKEKYIRNYVPIYLAMFLLLVVILYTYSRSGLLLYFCSVIYILYNNSKMKFLFYLIITIFIVFNYLLIIEDNILISRILDLFSGKDVSAQGRASVYYDLFKNLRDPFGYGADYALVVSHPTESFFLSSIISGGVFIGLTLVGFVLYFIRYFYVSRYSLFLSHVPFLVFITWFLDDNFYSFTSSFIFCLFIRYSRVR